MNALTNLITLALLMFAVACKQPTTTSTPAPAPNTAPQTEAAQAVATPAIVEIAPPEDNEEPEEIPETEDPFEALVIKFEERFPQLILDTYSEDIDTAKVSVLLTGILDGSIALNNKIEIIVMADEHEAIIDRALVVLNVSSTATAADDAKNRYILQHLQLKAPNLESLSFNDLLAQTQKKYQNVTLKVQDYAVDQKVAAKVLARLLSGATKINHDIKEVVFTNIRKYHELNSTLTLNTSAQATEGDLAENLHMLEFCETIEATTKKNILVHVVTAFRKKFPNVKLYVHYDIVDITKTQVLLSGLVMESIRLHPAIRELDLGNGHHADVYGRVAVLKLSSLAEANDDAENLYILENLALRKKK